jgi:hypothetical protein
LSGYASAHCHAFMQPIDMPRNRMQMRDAQRFSHQLVLEIDDVAVIVVRKFRL